MIRPDVLLRNHALQDAYEQAEAQNWLPIEINQISKGHFSGRMRVLEHDDVGIYLESQNCTIHKRSVMDEQLCTVSFFRNKQSRARFSEYAPADNALFFLPSGTEFDIHVPANVETAYFRLNQSSLLDKARAMNPSRWEDSPTSLQILDLLDRRSLDVFIEQIFSKPSFKSQTDVIGNNGSFAKIVMNQVLAALNSGYLNNNEGYPDFIARRRARSLVNCVIDYIKAQLDQDNCPNISDICYDVRVSERTLQYSFKTILELSPNTYLRYLRLNRVRAGLMRPANENVTVTSVATHWHFLHLGRFSRDYLQVFNELPSTTLHRALR